MEKTFKRDKPAKFGTVIGITDGGVEVYSCDYESAEKNQFPDRNSYRSTYNGIYTGSKYQCVELARRYLVINHGVTFDSIPMAFDIFNLRYFTDIKDNKKYKISSHLNNNSKILPVKGSLMIWKPEGHFKGPGHVAVVVNVTNDYVDIVEQNDDDKVWPEGQNYARRLPAKINQDGNFEVTCTYVNEEGGNILGWVTLHPNEKFVDEPIIACTKDDLKLNLFEVSKENQANQWLNKNDELQNLFLKTYGTGLSENPCSYYTITETAHKGLIQATERLHEMFWKAADFVVNNEDVVSKYFNIPNALIPKIRRSFFRERTTIASRFDFSITNGIKVLEYNSDSASCLYECGFIQNEWSKAAGIGHIGRHPAENLFQNLVELWKLNKPEGTLHILIEPNVDEKIHCLYMKSAAEAAGIKTKVIEGLDKFEWNKDQEILDHEGELIKTVWKTWSWATTLAQLTETDIQGMKREFFTTIMVKDTTKKPRLVDLLLSDSVKVYEPFWTYLTQNKAILPIIYNLFPDMPYVLKAVYELTPDLQQTGYVSKPVVGITGSNIKIVGADGKVIGEKKGKFEKENVIYQELSLLPQFDGKSVQVNCWSNKGKYGGTVLRVDKSNIIGYESDIIALRIV